ncbi:MAG: AAA family ATPase [Gammaproteobacteria bacterium]
MYASYFGLAEDPFAITPDPRYLFLSGRHNEALAHLLYGVTASGGFIQLTGEVGTGKTTLIRALLDKLPEHVDVALLINPRVNLQEFLRVICHELHVACDPQQSAQELIDTLNVHLLEAHARGRRVVLIIDEAQALSREVLEQVRLLTNLETSRQKLLQIILVGQPELRELLARQDLRQLAQRITGRYHLEPLSAKDTRAYIGHRLSVAGALAPIFTASGLRSVWRITRGVPRLVNILCDRALLGAYTRELRQVDGGLVRRAAREVFALPGRPAWGLLWLGAAAVVLLSTVTVLAATGRLSVGAGRRIATVPVPVSKPLVPLRASVGATPQAWLANPAHPSDTDMALHTLFAMWGAHYAAGGTGSGCLEAQQQGLRCLYRSGSWDNLRGFDRPAVITLTGEDGISHQVVVAKLTRGQVTLQAGPAEQSFPVAMLDSLWNGNYLLLWRPSASATVPLKPGMVGTGVVWLRTQLATLQHTTDSGSSTYDASLVAAVKRFQAAQQLAVDGVAGEETLIYLNTALNTPGTPTLVPRG